MNDDWFVRDEIHFWNAFVLQKRYSYFKTPLEKMRDALSSLHPTCLHQIPKIRRHPTFERSQERLIWSHDVVMFRELPRSRPLMTRDKWIVDG